MIYAYDKILLNNACKMLGTMFQFAVRDCNVDMASFFHLFATSPLGDRFGGGDYFILCGKSGMEIAAEILDIDTDSIDSTLRSTKGPEYWTGQVLAYYQWYCGKSFREIEEELEIHEIMDLYIECNKMEFPLVLNRLHDIRSEKRLMTYLQKYRKRAGLSQSELSERTDIPVKTIQQYEQRRKDINKAQAEYVFRLAKALCCRPEQLLEIDDLISQNDETQ